MSSLIDSICSRSEGRSATIGGDNSGESFIAVLMAGGTILVAMIVGTGCGREADPTSPEGGYRSFRKALIEGDAAAVWTHCDASTHRYFEQKYDTLVQMDNMIETYFPQTDRELARRQSGTVLLDDVDGPESLFTTVVRPKKLVIDQSKQLGLAMQRIEMHTSSAAEENANPDRAEIETRSGQTFRLVREEDGHWRVDLVDSVPAIRDKLAWLDANQSALEKTVNQRIAEARERREAIIADLMEVESTSDESQ